MFYLYDILTFLLTLCRVVQCFKDKLNMAALFMVMQNRRALRRQRVFRDRTNPLDYFDDVDIIKRYRLSRPLILQLCDIVRDDICRLTNRSSPLPVPLQVMVALRFYATGSFQTVIGDIHNVSKASVSRIVNGVSGAIARKSQHFISMPTNRQELLNISAQFGQISNLPNVLGAVDGTHIAIKAPVDEEHVYVNRKNFHSINVQGVCDANLKLLNVVCKWPGSTHDSFIWSSSVLNQIFEDGEITGGWLLGDSAYPLRPWLLTPILNPTNRKEENYNTAHARARNAIEKCFGVWRMRFRCIDHSGGNLLYYPPRACKIIIATAVLHNICIVNNLPLPNEPNGNQQRQTHDNGFNINRLNDGIKVRNRLIQRHF